MRAPHPAPQSLPLPPIKATRLEEHLQADIHAQTLTVRELVAGYCLVLHRKHRTIEVVVRLSGLDRRTVKPHIEKGRQLFTDTASEVAA